MTREEQMIDALAQLMAKQDGRDIEHRDYLGKDRWYASAYQKRDREDTHYRVKARKLYERWRLLQEWDAATGRE